MTTPRKDVLQETDEDAIWLARSLLRQARFGALAALDHETAAPIASRVAVATDSDGAPLILTSTLSAHTGALRADSRCALLVGEPGKGDPLAHPRLSLNCEAAPIDKDDPDHARIRRRYLNRHPKASLYVDFPDFGFFRLEPRSASLNGGFARAYRLERSHLLVETPAGLIDGEQHALDHMNADHADAVAIYARAFAGKTDGKWRLTGIDIEGVDLVLDEETARIAFPSSIAGADGMRAALVDMAKVGRKKLADVG